MRKLREYGILSTRPLGSGWMQVVLLSDRRVSFTCYGAEHVYDADTGDALLAIADAGLWSWANTFWTIALRNLPRGIRKRVGLD